MKQKSVSANPNKRVIKKSRFPFQIYIESYGVKIRVSTNDVVSKETILAMLPVILADRYRLTDPQEPDHQLFYSWTRNGLDSLYKNDEFVMIRTAREQVLDQINSEIRLTVAEFAVGRVFLHAGVVGWKGKAIVMPAPSFSGKSALTAELVRRGARYYSDEYAVLDQNGLVSPFPKHLSIRGEIDDYTQVNHPVERFGGKAGKRSIPVGMVLITKFKPRGRWKPQIMSSGKGLMEIIRNTVPIRNDPAFALSVLNKVARSATIVKSTRGEASESVDEVLRYFEANCL